MGGVLLILMALLLETTPATGQGGGPGPVLIPSFKSSIDLVRINAVVRDKKGRLVANLTARDFEVTDGGESRPIVDFESEVTPVSLALLLDVSGSMEGHLASAREAAMHVLSWLDTARDEAAVFAFDTRLLEVSPFRSGLQALPDSFSSITPFGATSLHDAIARTAERLGGREGRRRGVVVFTDGQDNWSRLTVPEVSAIASAIEVPIYIIGTVATIDNPTAENFASVGDRSAFTGPLGDLAQWTGGRTFIVSTAAERSVVARQVVDELHHQYLIAFESSGKPGWHPLVIRARGKDLTVRARGGYVAGQSRPISQ
jgi:Ca-activated chloride channel family protein